MLNSLIIAKFAVLFESLQQIPDCYFVSREARGGDRASVYYRSQIIIILTGVASSIIDNYF